jgi:Raf kinase inhibitor-like YbhB/YbcL family protein/uncharacterized protein (TIGR00297 family)
MSLLFQIPLGLLLAAIIAVAAFYAHTLNRSGALAAFVLGTVIFGFGGIYWAILLMAFFLSSSLLSRLFKKQKKSVEANFSKGSQRDAGQVAANGAIAGVCALLFSLMGNPGWLWAAGAGALAAANADTWATEIGILGKAKPRLITTGKIVEAGTSGGVSLVGLLAATMGSVLIALIALWLKPESISNSMENNLLLPVIVTVAGVAGSLLDSLLGAASQAMYFCESCQKVTEKHPLHGCGNPTRLTRGWAWLDNDWVNTFCTLAGSLTAAILAVSSISSTPLLLSNVGGVEMQKLTLSSPAFLNGQSIPRRFTCVSENLSPSLKWADIPASTRSLALIADDPDAPMGTFTHWVIYNIPPDSTELPEGMPSGKLPGGGTQGLNSARQNAYMGPCPPAGKVHRYFFRLYAIDLLPNLTEGLTAEKLSSAIASHTLAYGEWMGTFQR